MNKTAIRLKKAAAVLAGLLCFLTPGAALAKVESNLSFTPAAMPAGSPARASVIVQNSDPFPGNDLNFTMTLPEGLKLHGGGNLSSSCGGSPALSQSGGRIALSLSGGAIPAASGANPGSCVISFDLTAMRKQTFVMEIPVGSIRANFGGSVQANTTPAQSSLDVTMAAITIAVKSPHGLDAKGGQAIPHSYTFRNTNNIPVTGMSMDVDMSVIANTWIALGPPLENSCGGDFEITRKPSPHNDVHWVEATVIHLRSASIPARSSCTLTYLTTPARVIETWYTSNGNSRRLPAELIATDQGVTNEMSNDEYTRFRVGINSRTLINGQVHASLNVPTGEEGELTFEVMNSSLPATGNLVLPIPIPNAIDVRSQSSNCGTIVRTSTGVEWSFAVPGAPPEPTVDFETASCTATLRVRARFDGTYKVALVAKTYSGYHVGGSSIEITGSMSPISVESGFDVDRIYAADSSIFRLRLSNKLADQALEDVTVRNPVQSHIHGAVIGLDGVVENTCAGARHIIAGDRSGITFEDISLPPGASCVLAYQVTLGSGSIDERKTTYILKTNTLGPDDITFRGSDGQQVSWGTSVYSQLGVLFNTQVYAWILPQTASAGSQARLHISVSRSSAEGHGMHNIGMRLDLAEGIVIDKTPNFTTTCGGEHLSRPGDAFFHFDGGAVASEPGWEKGVCKLEANVRLPLLGDAETSKLIESSFLPDHSLGPRRSFWAQDNHVEGPAGYVALPYAPLARVTIVRYDLGLGLEFADAAVGGSGSTRVRISLSNQANATLDLSDVSMDVDLTGTGVKLAAVADPSYRVKSGPANACGGGSFSVLPNGLRISGASIARGAICEVEFSVTAASGGNHIISIPAKAVSTDQGVTNPSGVYATLTVGYLLSAGIGFDPNLIAEGGETEFIIEIINTMTDDGNSDYNGKGVSITQEIPSWAAVAGSPTTNCQGATTNVFMGRLLLNYGKFPASSSCQVSVPVRVAASGSYQAVLPAGSIHTLESVTNTAAFTAAVRVLKAPTLTVVQAPGMTGTGRTAAATLHIHNPNDTTLNPEGFSGLSLAIEAVAPLELVGRDTASTCSGYSAQPTPEGLGVSGITLPAASSCQITLAGRADTPGLHPSQAGGLMVQQVDLPVAPSVELAWQVVADPTVRMSLVGEAPDSELPFRLGIEIDNPNDVPVGLAGPGLALVLPDAPGDMVLGEEQPLVSGCGTAALSAPAGDSSLAISGGSLAAGSKCQVEVSLIGSTGGEYVLRPAPLLLEYGLVAVDPVTVTLLSTHANLSASRSMRVLARKVASPEACAALEEADTGLTVALPGSCIEVTVTVKNPSSEKKTARDMVAGEIIGDNLALASITTGNFDRVTEDSGALAARIEAIAPGETKTFSYRAVLQ